MYCSTCKDAPSTRWSRDCEVCRTARYVFRKYGSGQTLAALEVARARKKGTLCSPRSLQCADCGGAAIEYDHRDYNAPLVVEAVCRGCNLRRGSATPKSWSFDEFRAWFVGREACRIASDDDLLMVERNHFRIRA